MGHSVLPKEIAGASLVLVWLLVPVLGAVQLMLISSMHNANRRMGSRKLRFFLYVLAGLEFAVACSVGWAVLAGIAWELPAQQTNVVLWLAVLEGAALAALLLFSARAAGAVARKFPKFDPLGAATEEPSSNVETNRYEGNLAFARLMGWSAVLLPTIFVIPVLVFFFGFFGVLAVVAAVAVAQSVRSRHAQLLWVLAISAEKGFSLGEEVEAFALTCWSHSRRRLRLLADRLHGGIPVSEALEEVPGIVPRYVVAAARIGEQTGTLPSALRDAAERETAVMKENRVAPSAPWVIAYYWSVASITCSVLLFLMTYIAPKFKAIFEGFEVDLPPAMVGLFDTSSSDAIFAVAAPILGLPALVLGLCAVGYVHGWSNLKVPWLTRWFRRYDTPWLLRNLARTIEARRPLTLALSEMAGAHHRPHIARWMREAEAVVSDGGDCWETFYQQGLLRARERDVMHAAARAGNLSWALRHVADTLESRLRRRVFVLLDVLRIAIVAFAACMVGAVAIAFFTPLVRLLERLAI